jgi:hypothetical protein
MFGRRRKSVFAPVDGGIKRDSSLEMGSLPLESAILLFLSEYHPVEVRGRDLRESLRDPLVRSDHEKSSWKQALQNASKRLAHNRSLIVR